MFMRGLRLRIAPFIRAFRSRVQPPPPLPNKIRKRKMVLKEQIVKLLNEQPGLDSNQIAKALDAKVTSIKVTLCKLVNAEKVSRIKEPHDEKKPGRKNPYRYKVKTD